MRLRAFFKKRKFLSGKMHANIHIKYWVLRFKNPCSLDFIHIRYNYHILFLFLQASACTRATLSFSSPTPSTLDRRAWARTAGTSSDKYSVSIWRIFLTHNVRWMTAIFQALLGPQILILQLSSQTCIYK